jgi:hypothetical protein
VISPKQHEDERLFNLMLEQLKVPLLHIARQSENAIYGNTVNFSDINSVAEMSVKMIDSYLLTKGQNSQISLELEPVSISSVLNSAANNIHNLAKLYDCNVELHIRGKYVPVMSSRVKLEAAFTMLGYSFIEANVANRVKKQKGRVILSGYKSSKGLSAGIFSPEIIVSQESFTKAQETFGSSKQTMPEISHSTGAGIFIANTILNDLATKLRVAHFNKISGMAITLMPSQQLSLV